MIAVSDNTRRRLRVQEAAEYCGLSVSYLDKRRHYGDGPVFLKIGKAVIYDTADLDQWLAGKNRTSTSDTGERNAA